MAASQNPSAGTAASAPSTAPTLADPRRWSHHWRSGGPMPLAQLTARWSHATGGRHGEAQPDEQLHMGSWRYLSSRARADVASAMWALRSRWQRPRRPIGTDSGARHRARNGITSRTRRRPLSRTLSAPEMGHLRHSLRRLSTADALMASVPSDRISLDRLAIGAAVPGTCTPCIAGSVGERLITRPGPSQSGLMFWLPVKRLVGSHCVLMAARRRYFSSPYAARTRASPSSPTKLR